MENRSMQKMIGAKRYSTLSDENRLTHNSYKIVYGIAPLVL